MIINRTLEFINYRRSFQTGIERAPKYFRRSAGIEYGSDIIEISERGRIRHMEDNYSPLVKGVMRAIQSQTSDIIEPLQASEKDFDIIRHTRVEELRRMMREDRYDFDAALVKTANEVLLQLDDKVR
ncbi:MAG: hypothetical protein A2176_07935 [Spirochaetes bacterium RBG_13_51_14]|nr:MAG: hypothetical protein A2176_07935 [Spirochaetes bacterium RBG_13_51_14]